MFQKSGLCGRVGWGNDKIQEVKGSSLHQNNPLQKCKLLFWQNRATTLLSQCSPQLREVCESHRQPGLGFTVSTL